MAKMQCPRSSDTYATPAANAAAIGELRRAAVQLPSAGVDSACATADDDLVVDGVVGEPGDGRPLGGGAEALADRAGRPRGVAGVSGGWADDKGQVVQGRRDRGKRQGSEHAEVMCSHLLLEVRSLFVFGLALIECFNVFFSLKLFVAFVGR